MKHRKWFESDGPLVPVVPAHAWVGETIEPAAPDIQMTDKDGNVILTIYAGAHPVRINRLGADMVFEWKPAPESDAQ